MAWRRQSAMLVAAATLLAATGSTTTAIAQDCVPTQSDALGPYYVSNAPRTDNFNRHRRPGDPLRVTGLVRSAGKDQPSLQGATVEVWQTDGAGDYYPESNGDAADYKPTAVDLRGTVLTGADGQYDFRTVAPGAYGFRPRHFHYRISAPGPRTLVTQFYVTGDGFVRQPGAPCRHAPIVGDGEDRRYEAPTVYLERTSG